MSQDIEKFQEDDSVEEHIINAPIFVCWWSGLESSPELVKICIRSIKDHAGNHPVFLIDQNNVGDYLKIPKHILDLVNTDQICLANFSDYLRFSLLNQYGGLWIDSTVYCSSGIPDKYFEFPLFTCNAKPGTGYISDGKWTSFIIGGNKGHTLFKYIQAAFETYWRKERNVIDYLMLDYLIRLGYMYIPQIKKDLDSIPLNNLHRNELRLAMNRGEPGETLEQYIYEDTCFNKLSWRESYSVTNAKGQKTVYAAFMNLAISNKQR